MGKYILKRLFYILLVFAVLSLVIYLVYDLLPVDKAYDAAYREVRANKELDFDERYEYWSEVYGQDGSVLHRYLRWIGVYPYADGRYDGLIEGNLGESSYYGKPVAEVIGEPMKNTVLINTVAMLLSLGITIPLGILSALRRGGRTDTLVRVGTVVGYSLPTFIIAIVFIWLFSVRLGWFPVSGMNTPGLIDATASERFFDTVRHLVLPIGVLVVSSLGTMTRYTRAAMIDAMSLDCIRTARAKGLPERSVVLSHAWRNAMIPVVTLAVGWFLSVFSGSVMIENIFSLNGIGRVYFEALNNADNEVVLALQMLYVLLGLLGNLAVDIAYGLIDPRIGVNK